MKKRNLSRVQRAISQGDKLGSLSREKPTEATTATNKHHLKARFVRG